jgi:hypothetical protein
MVLLLTTHVLFFVDAGPVAQLVLLPLPETVLFLTVSEPLLSRERDPGLDCQWCFR